VRWYLRYALSYRDLEEMMLDRGLRVDHTTIYRWVQRYAPELEKRCRPHLKASNDSWRVDETYIKIKNIWTYLYRAVDSEGNTLEFLLIPTRDAEAAERFFFKALPPTMGSVPQDGLTQERMKMKDSSAKRAPQSIAPTDLEVRKTIPRVINVDKNAAYPKVIADLKAAGILPEHVELRQVEISQQSH
jgi:transposase, IS6 family